jgi:hypothetical protein
LDAFAEMYAEPSVMCDLGGPISLEESRAKLLRYISMYEDFGFSRYCVEDVDGQFVGYVGVCPRDDGQTIGKNNEIDWRLRKDVWGKGYRPAVENGKTGSKSAITPFVEPTAKIVKWSTEARGSGRKMLNTGTFHPVRMITTRSQHREEIGENTV